MITAKEAQKVSECCNKRLYEQTLGCIERQITDAAEKGDYSVTVTVKQTFIDQISEVLGDVGYNVEIAHDYFNLNNNKTDVWPIIISW